MDDVEEQERSGGESRRNAYLIGIGPFAPLPFPSVTGGTLVPVLGLFGPGWAPYAILLAVCSLSLLVLCL